MIADRCLVRCFKADPMNRISFALATLVLVWLSTIAHASQALSCNAFKCAGTCPATKPAGIVSWCKRCCGAAAGVRSAVGSSSTASPKSRCKPGRWLNKDGTCTRYGFYHCNIDGVNWECPGRAGRCSLRNGRTMCIR